MRGESAPHAIEIVVTRWLEWVIPNAGNVTSQASQVGIVTCGLVALRGPQDEEHAAAKYASGRLDTSLWCEEKCRVLAKQTAAGF